MLQQILRDMYVDPEILAELDEQQKQTLFCKMREEQVRRWKAWNEKLGEDEHIRSNSNKKKSVSFLRGSDGEPWVWVMGDHKNDKSIDDILKKEAIEKARKMAEKETEQLRKQVEAQLSEYIELSPKIDNYSPKIENFSPKIDNFSPKIENYKQERHEYENDMDIYCSVDELREKMEKMDQPKIPNNSLDHYQNQTKFNFVEAREVLQEISINAQQKVAQRVALWEKKLTEERTSEIFKNIQKKHEQVAREAEEEERRKEQLWREQERKAKQAEQQIREIARRARAEHRLSTTQPDLDTNYGTVNAGVPPGRQAVLEWYRDSEKCRGAGVDESNNVAEWFHGLITRQQAENLLLDQPYGSFLVRLSERLWGYAISYRSKEKCKHYLVQAVPKYCFLGSNQVEHNGLADLISHHQKQPLTGGEVLIHPCARNSSTAIDELFKN